MEFFVSNWMTEMSESNRWGYSYIISENAVEFIVLEVKLSEEDS